MSHSKNIEVAFVPIMFIFLVCSLLPIPAHIRARNIATTSTFAWTALHLLFKIINMMEWYDNVEIKLLRYCDLSVFLTVAVAWAFPASMYCITRHLESISSYRYTSTVGMDSRRKRMILEALMCIVMPIVFAGLHYLVQGVRFHVSQYLGCMADTWDSWTTIFIYYLPPVILSVLSLLYSLFSVRWLIERRAQFREHLSSSQTGVTMNRYIRLMGMTLLGSLYSVAACSYFLTGMWLSWKDTGIQSYRSFAFVHTGYDYIPQYPAILSSYENVAVVFLAIQICPSILQAIFFSFARETLNEYVRFWHWIRVRVLRLSPSSPSSSFHGSRGSRMRGLDSSVNGGGQTGSAPDMTQSTMTGGQVGGPGALPSYAVMSKSTHSFGANGAGAGTLSSSARGASRKKRDSLGYDISDDEDDLYDDLNKSMYTNDGDSFIDRNGDDAMDEDGQVYGSRRLHNGGDIEIGEAMSDDPRSLAYRPPQSATPAIAVSTSSAAMLRTGLTHQSENLSPLSPATPATIHLSYIPQSASLSSSATESAAHRSPSPNPHMAQMSAPSTAQTSAITAASLSLPAPPTANRARRVPVRTQAASPSPLQEGMPARNEEDERRLSLSDSLTYSRGPRAL